MQRRRVVLTKRLRRMLKVSSHDKHSSCLHPTGAGHTQNAHETAALDVTANRALPPCSEPGHSSDKEARETHFSKETAQVTPSAPHKAARAQKSTGHAEDVLRLPRL